MINEGYHNLTSRERQSYTEKVRQSNTKSVRQNNRVIGAALRRAAMLLCMIIMGIGGTKGQSFSGQLKSGVEPIDRYVKWSQNSAEFSVLDMPEKLGISLSDFADNYYIKLLLSDKISI